MSLRILAIDPSYWQRTAAGLLAVLVVGLLVAVAVEALARIVFAPRAAGRRWPEGAGRGGILRIPAAMVIELQRRTPALEGRAADLADGAVAVRVGLALGTLAVVPLSTGLVVAQPGSGLFVLPVLLVADAVVLAVLQVVIADPAARDRRRADAAERALVRIGAACVLGLSGGAVVAQWGSASLPVVVAAQAHTAAFGIAGWGLPTALVQLPALLVACAMLHLVAVRLSPAAAERPLGGRAGSSTASPVRCGSWRVLRGWWCASWVAGRCRGGSTTTECVTSSRWSSCSRSSWRCASPWPGRA